MGIIAHCAYAMKSIHSYQQDYQFLHSLNRDNFTGRTILKHRKELQKLCSELEIESLLDYGCGKAGAWKDKMAVDSNNDNACSLAEYLNVPIVALYDIGVPEYANLPVDKFDLVVSIDVLEHIPVETLGRVLSDIFSHAKKYVYLTIASYPARKLLPDGRNAHVTIRKPKWWLNRLLPVIRKYQIPATIKVIEAAHFQNPNGYLLSIRRFFGMPSRRITIVKVNAEGSAESIIYKFKKNAKGLDSL